MPRNPFNKFGSVLFVCILLLGAFVPADESAEKTLKTGGVGSALGTARLLAATFEKKHPDVEIRVLPSLGASGSIKAVNQGAINIGIAGRPMREDERKIGLHTLEYARTALVFVTGKEIKKAISNLNKWITKENKS